MEKFIGEDYFIITPFSELLEGFERKKQENFTLDEKIVGRIAQIGIVNENISEEFVLEKILTILSHKNLDQIQNDLLDFIGPEKLDFIIELINNRADVYNDYVRHEKKRYLRHQQVMNEIEEQTKVGKFGQQVTVQSERMKTFQKSVRKEGKKYFKLRKGLYGDEMGDTIDEECLDQLKEKEILELYGMPEEAPKYPHIYSREKTLAIVAFGAKFTLPKNTIHHDIQGSHEEFIMPYQDTKRAEYSIPILGIDAFPEIFWPVFEGYSSLNKMQSAVFSCGFCSNENMLICAPTGAGKTDVAMMVLLKVVLDHMSEKDENGRIHIATDEFKAIYIAPMKALASEIVAKFSRRLSYLKIIVKECTGDTDLSKKEIEETQVLVTTPEKWDVITRKGALHEANLLSKVKCIIIDEVHLLNETSRGVVIESIVARMLRLIEQHQKGIRLVGLSATLPNYADVAEFLRVNPWKGLFYFDGSFRPVPLTQILIGIKKPCIPGRNIQQNMNEICFEKCFEFIKEGHQVMIFVHSRNETGKTARILYDLARIQQVTELFTIQVNEKIPTARINSSELKWLLPLGFGIHHAGLVRTDRHIVEKEFSSGNIRCLICTATLAWGVNLPAHTVIIKGTSIYDAQKGALVDLSILDILQIFGRAGRPQYESHGVGVLLTTHDKLAHYLGLLSQSRDIESSFFTSKLESNLNAEICLGTVNSLQEALIWTQYTYAWIRIRKNPLLYGLNKAEVAKDPSLQSYLYKWVYRAVQRLSELGLISAKETKDKSLNLKCKEMGRIASHYYLSIDTIERFLKRTREEMSSSDVLSLLASSSEFEQLKVRDDELVTLGGLVGKRKLFSSHPEIASLIMPRLNKQELNGIRDAFNQETEERTPLYIANDINSREGKVNILLQAYISGWRGSESGASSEGSLLSDMNYVINNAPRLSRALLEVLLQKKWTNAFVNALSFVRCIENEMWELMRHPLEQLKIHFTENVRFMLRSKRNIYTIPILKEIADQALKEGYCGYDGIIEEFERVLETKNAFEHQQLMKAIQSFPCIDFAYECFPITSTVMRVNLGLYPHFKKGIASFWILVRDPINSNKTIFTEYISINSESGKNESESAMINDRNYLKSQRSRKLLKEATICFEEPSEAIGDMEDDDNVVNHNEASTTLSFVVQIPTGPQQNKTQLVVEMISDQYFGCDSSFSIPLSQIHFPTDPPILYTELLALKPLPLSALNCPLLEAYYHQVKGLSFLNPIQSQVFHRLYYGIDNIFLGAPTGSGKTMAAELAIWNTLRQDSLAKVVYIVPLKALLQERVKEWKVLWHEWFGINVVEMSGETHASKEELREARVIMATPEKWDIQSRNTSQSYISHVKCIIIDEIHLLGSGRGIVLEGIVARIKCLQYQHKMNIRMIGLSTCLANIDDIKEWLGIPSENIVNFRASVRPVPVTLHIEGFSGRHYCSRMASMNKSIFEAIVKYAHEKPALIFVSSRRQTRLTAQALIEWSSLTEGNHKRWLRTHDADDMRHIQSIVQDSTLSHTLAYGVGLHHAGLSPSDRSLVESLYFDRKILLLIATSTLAWGLNFPTYMVIIKGTEYYDSNVGGYVDLSMMDLGQMIGRAGRPQFDTDAVALICTLKSKKDYYKRFLMTPFPLESSLHLRLADAIAPEMINGSIRSRKEALAYLSWTFLAQRIQKNPIYYGARPDSISLFLKGIVEEAIEDLKSANIIMEEYDGDEGELQFIPSPFGKIASQYYLGYRTLQSWTHLIPSTRSLPLDVQLGVVLEHLMSSTCEFSLFPLRHAEDIYLKEGIEPFIQFKIQPPLGFRKGKDPIYPYLYKSWIKAFYLIQCTWLHPQIQFPIIDFVNDSHILIENFQRIGPAFLDTMAELNELGKVLSMAHAIQSVKCQAPPFASPDIVLKHYLPHCNIQSLKQNGIFHLCQLMACDEAKLRTLSRHCQISKEDIINIKTLPIVNVSYKFVDPIVASPKRLLVTLRLKQPPPIDELSTWWVVLGDFEPDILLALRKFHAHTLFPKLELLLDFIVPQTSTRLKLYLLTDTWIGIDQEYSIDL